MLPSCPLGITSPFPMSVNLLLFCIFLHLCHILLLIFLRFQFFPLQLIYSVLSISTGQHSDPVIQIDAFFFLHYPPSCCSTVYISNISDITFVFLLLTEFTQYENLVLSEVTSCIHIAADAIILFFFMAEQCSVVYMHHICLIHSSAG